MANEIWSILGRDRNAYVSRDVFSDDEDMEADASILEREEKLRFGYRCVFKILKGLPFSSFLSVPALPNRKILLHSRRSAAARRKSAGERKKR